MTKRFTTHQWRIRLTPQLQAALGLPIREFRRGGTACAAAHEGTTAIYLVNGQHQALEGASADRGSLPRHASEVESLLPNDGSSPDATFELTWAVR